LAVGLPLLHVWITSAFVTVTQRNTKPHTPTPDHHPAQKYFLAMEDGLFLVPLLWVGITPITAAIASLMYAFFIYGRQSLSMVATRSVAYFLLIIWVLPQDLWMVVAAHAVSELAIRYLFPYWFTIVPAAQQEGTR
jgi:hypothetical protein